MTSSSDDNVCLKSDYDTESIMKLDDNLNDEVNIAIKINQLEH